jgi:hypothetical protein
MPTQPGKIGFAAGFDFAIEPGVVPVNLFDPALSNALSTMTSH